MAFLAHDGGHTEPESDSDDEMIAFMELPDEVEVVGPTEPVSEPYAICLEKVLELFPDIAHDHVRKLWEAGQTSSTIGREETVTSQQLVEVLLDGGSYPKERDRLRDLKRKRESADDPEHEAAKWRHALTEYSPRYGELA